jgi:hypothetical protein
MSEDPESKPKIISLRTKKEFVPPPAQAGEGPQVDEKLMLALDVVKGYAAEGRITGLLLATFDRSQGDDIICFTQFPMGHPVTIGSMMLRCAAQFAEERAEELFYHGTTDLAALGGYELDDEDDE